jgi:hypothetical protein
LRVIVSAWYALNMKEFLDPETLSRVMRHVASKRRRQDTMCQRCGKAIPDAYRKRRYCSTSCRVLAHRARQSAAEQGG